MFCSQCGQPNPDNSAFCANCGASLSGGTSPQPTQPIQYQQNTYPAQNQYAPQNQNAAQSQYTPKNQYAAQSQYAPQSQAPYAYPQAPQQKSRKGLIVGLSIGLVVVLLGIAAILLLGRGGGDVVGIWQCEEYGEVMEFSKSGSVDIYTASKDYSGKYDYTAKSGKGVIYADNGEFPFAVKGDTLSIEGRRVFKRADEAFSIPEFLEREDAPASMKPGATPKSAIAPTAQPTVAPVKGTATEQTMTLQFAFGSRTGDYTGDLLDGLPHGQGTFMTSSEEGVIWAYEGGWEAGHFSGEGATYWEDGFSEGGEYKNDALNGQGWESWYDALQYEGDYRNSEFHGNGKLYNCFGEIIYEGSFENGWMTETEIDRGDRVGAFKDQSVPTEHEDLYDACNEGIDIRSEVTGQVFDVFYEPNDYPGYCYLYLFNPYSNDYELTGVFYFLQKGEMPPEIDQVVTVWGTPQYLSTFTDTDGNEWTIPQIMAWNVE